MNSVLNYLRKQFVSLWAILLKFVWIIFVSMREVAASIFRLQNIGLVLAESATILNLSNLKMQVLFFS